MGISCDQSLTVVFRDLPCHTESEVVWFDEGAPATSCSTDLNSHCQSTSRLSKHDNLWKQGAVDGAYE